MLKGLQKRTKNAGPADGLEVDRGTLKSHAKRSLLTTGAIDACDCLPHCNTLNYAITLDCNRCELPVEDGRLYESDYTSTIK